VVCKSQHSPSYFIDGLVCGYSEKVRKEKLLVILNAYADDSGSDESSANAPRYFVLAGYVLPIENWKSFSDRWDAELRREPPINCFKMSDAEYGDGCFEGIPEPFRKLKVNDLAQVICDFKPKPISAHLEWTQYKSIVEGRVHEKMASPYAILFYQIMKQSHDWQIELNKHNPNIGWHRVDFVFDEQGKIGLRALQWYSKLKEVLPEPYKNMMGNTPDFRDDEEIVALQAADMLAWHLHRFLENNEDRPLLDKIAQHHEGKDVNEKALRSFVELAQRIDPKELDASF
jgi:Protein of unknown function (DUF3800)